MEFVRRKSGKHAKMASAKEGIKSKPDMFHVAREDVMVFQRMLEQCKLHRLTSDCIVLEWVAFSTAKGGVKLTLENLEKFEREVLNKKVKSRPIVSVKEETLITTREATSVHDLGKRAKLASVTADIQSELDVFDIACTDEKVLEKLVEQCKHHRLKSDCIVLEWVAFSTTKGGLKLNLDSLERFEHEVLNKKVKSRPSVSVKEETHNKTRDATSLHDLVKRAELESVMANIQSELDAFDVAYDDEKVLEKMLEQCKHHRLKSDCIVLAWVAFSTAKGGLKLNLDSLKWFEHKVLNKRVKCRPSLSEKGETLSKTRVMNSLQDLIKAEEEMENLQDSYYPAAKGSQKRAQTMPQYPHAKRRVSAESLSAPLPGQPLPQ